MTTVNKNIKLISKFLISTKKAQASTQAVDSGSQRVDIQSSQDMGAKKSGRVEFR